MILEKSCPAGLDLAIGCTGVSVELNEPLPELLSLSTSGLASVLALTLMSRGAGSGLAEWKATREVMRFARSVNHCPPAVDRRENKKS